MELVENNSSNQDSLEIETGCTLSGGDINNLFSTPLDVYRSYKNPSLFKTICFGDLINRIKDARLDVPEKTSIAYDPFKAKQNCVTVNGHFRSIPSYETFVNSTGLIFVEIDTKETLSLNERKVKAFESKNHYFNLPFVVCAYLSLSKTSAHFIIKIDDTLKSEMSPTFFKRLYKHVNYNYFNKLLDTSCSNLNRFTALSQDKDILVKSTFKELNKEDINSLYTHHHNEDTNTSYLMVKKDIKGSCPLFEYYPSMVERFFFKPVIDDVEGVLEYAHNYHEYPHRMGYKKHKYVANYRTCISEQFFFNENGEFERNKPIFFREGINFCEWIMRPALTKESKRKFTLLAFSRVILFNTPFISEEHFITTLFDFNRRHMEYPLTDYEIEQVASYNYEKFQSGELEFDKESMRIRKKYVWFSSFCNLEPSERISISRKIFMDNTTATIYAAIEELQGTKKITQRNIANAADVDVRTIRRHFKEYPELVEYCKQFNPHVVKPNRKITGLNPVELVKQQDQRMNFRELFGDIENRDLINIFYRSFRLTENDYVDEHVKQDDVEFLKFMIQSSEHWIIKKYSGSIIQIMSQLFPQIAISDILTFLGSKSIPQDCNVRDWNLFHFDKTWTLKHVIDEFHESKTQF